MKHQNCDQLIAKEADRERSGSHKIITDHAKVHLNTVSRHFLRQLGG